MSPVNRVPITLAAIAAAFAITAVLPALTTPAEAHGYKHRDGDRHASRHLRRHKHSRSYGRSYRRRDRAIFAHEVDLSRPGGTERFFELLREENR